MKLTRDIHSLSTFKRDTAKLVRQLKKTGQPVVLTVNGKAELHAIHPRHAEIRAIELLLHDDVVVTIACFQGCDARLARFTRMITRTHAAAWQMRDVPVVFHSQWFSSFLHGELFLLVDAKPMQQPLTHPRRMKQISTW